MKILLLGKNGQVGWELQRALAPLGELIALDRAGEESPLGFLCGDLSDLDGLVRTVRLVAPDVIVNAAAIHLHIGVRLHAQCHMQGRTLLGVVYRSALHHVSNGLPQPASLCQLKQARDCLGIHALLADIQKHGAGPTGQLFCTRGVMPEIPQMTGFHGLGQCQQPLPGRKTCSCLHVIQALLPMLAMHAMPARYPGHATTTQ